jgi:hypothetical protein
MTARTIALGVVAALAVVLTTAGCTPQQDVDPNGRCLHWQMAVTAEVHPTASGTAPSWDLTFTDTSTAACVFGGVPTVRLLGATAKNAAGLVTRAASEEWAIQLAPGDVAYANMTLDPSASTSCTAKVRVRTLAVGAPHVAGGGFTVKAPAEFTGCAGKVAVAHVGQVTAKRAR